PRLLRPHRFPSTTLFRSSTPPDAKITLCELGGRTVDARVVGSWDRGRDDSRHARTWGNMEPLCVVAASERHRRPQEPRSATVSLDRKSTRLNSSHVKISY